MSALPKPPDDIPTPDRIWEGMLALIGGTLAVAATAVAVAGTLGWPRRAPAELTGWQIGVLAAVVAAPAAVLLWRAGGEADGGVSDADRH